MLLFTQLVLVPRAAAQPITVTYGDQTVEQATDTLTGDMVEAFLRINVTQPVVIQSVSFYLQYTGSDGSQCMKFGIYRDDPFGSWSPRGQPLVAATQNGYCVRGSIAWGPAWITWKLLPSDYLTIAAPGVYWISALAKQTFGTIYHYTIGQVYNSAWGYYYMYYNYTYAYNNYAFYSPYSQGFLGNFSTTPSWQGNAPYSIYVTGTVA